MNWTEKYRPKKIEGIIGQQKFKKDALSWIIRGDMPNLLLYGPPGTGKTSAGIVLAKEFLGDWDNSNFKEINASQDRRLETVRKTVTKFTKTSIMGDVPFKILLLDELDGMTKDAQRALKRVMEKAQNVRFIITCNDNTGIDYALKSRCANYLFNPIDKDSIEFLLKTISSQEHYEIDIEELENFCKTLNGDLRRGINELQAGAFSGRPLADVTKAFLIDYEECINNICNGDGHTALMFLHEQVYRGVSVKEMANKLHQVILEVGAEAQTKFRLLATLGEMEWRSNSMTPKILISWFIANVMRK